MSWFNCFPGVGLSPFEDPSPDSINTLVAQLQERIAGEQRHIQLHATPYELQECHLKRVLKRFGYDVELGLNHWHAWVQWRHDMKVDEITDEEIQHELQEGIFAWRGKNQEGMPCCVITGRLLDPVHRRGSHQSFKKFLIRLVEQGMQLSDQQSFTTQQDHHDKICIIYDRRGLSFENIDPNLYQFCNKTLDELREWYAERIGAVYILETNWLFWILYHVILKPLLAIYAKEHTLICLEKSEDLLAYFDADQLLLLSPETTASSLLQSLEEGERNEAVEYQKITTSNNDVVVIQDEDTSPTDAANKA